MTGNADNHRDDSLASKDKEQTMIISDKTISFDDVAIDFKMHTIYWKGVEQEITGKKCWELLEMLISESPRLLCYDAIYKKLWPKRSSRDEKLRKNIQGIILKIRKAIHDDSNSPKYVVPTPGKGYTFAIKYDVFDSSKVIPETIDNLPSQEEIKLTVKWTDGTKKCVEIYKELKDEERGRKYYQFVCDGKRYCASIVKDSAGRENWKLVSFVDWIDLAASLRKKQLNSQILSIEDCDLSVYEYASKQKERIEQVLVKYPQLTVYFNGKGSPMPSETQKEMCFSLATIIGSYFQSVEPVLNHLPYYYACSILDWERKVLSSPIMEMVVYSCPWFWEFIV